MSEVAQTSGDIPQWTLADRLRKAREHAGMEQGELAAAIGVGRNTISNYERAAHAPREIVLRAWALATGVPLEWLRTGVAPHPADANRGLHPTPALSLVPPHPGPTDRPPAAQGHQPRGERHLIAVATA